MRFGIRLYSEVISYYFSIKWLTPFYPAKDSQAAGGGEKCMDLRFLRLRRRLLKQQPNKTVFNRFIENQYHISLSSVTRCAGLWAMAFAPAASMSAVSP